MSADIAGHRLEVLASERHMAKTVKIHQTRDAASSTVHPAIQGPIVEGFFLPDRLRAGDEGNAIQN